MRHPGLTVRQAEVLCAVRAWIAEYGYPPTFRELGPIIGTSGSGAREAIVVLERKGCVVRDRDTSRGLRLVGPTPGVACVHPASAVVAYRDGVPSGVAYRVTSFPVSVDGVNHG